MKKRIFVISFAMLLLSAGSLFAAEKTDISRRRVIVKQWLSSGDEIVRKTGNQNGKAIMDFLHSSLFVGAPLSQNGKVAIKILEKPGKRKYYLCAVPLISGDRKINAEWENIYDRNLAASYDSAGDNPHMILKEQGQYSKTWQGLIFVHEGSHALADAAGVLNEIGNPMARRSMGEYYAYGLETEMVEKIGGSAYQKLLQEEIGRLEKNYKKNKKFLFPDYGRYRERLEVIFGKSQSGTEIGVRGSVFWINAVFRLIDRTYKSEDERGQRKVEFLRKNYENGNMM
jgi:hypothetical protein